VIDVDVQDALKLPAAADQEPIEAVAAMVPTQFGEHVCPVRETGADDVDAFAAKTSSKARNCCRGRGSRTGPVLLARK
jgi:hypothetical protein